VELGPPSGDRTWADVGRALRLNPSARLSAPACREVVRAYLDLRTSIERIADDPTSTRAELRDLVPDERRAKARAQAAEMRRRRAEHDSWMTARGRGTRAGRELSDEEILAIPKMMGLLKAVAEGRVTAGEADRGVPGLYVMPGGETFPDAAVRWLADLRLIDRAGPLPTVTERGRRLVWLWRRS
jgi:hypothetical protein